MTTKLITKETYSDVPEVFNAWQAIWTWHRRMAGDGT
jgi:putative transposase